MSRSSKPEHPIRRWRRANEVSPEQYAALVEAHGGKLTHRSLGEIELGRRRPSYELAKILIAVGNEESRSRYTIDQLLTWPLHLVPSEAAKRKRGAA